MVATHPAIRGASAWAPLSSDCACAAAVNASSAELVFSATGVQHPRRHVQEHCGGRVDDGHGDLPGPAQPALCVVELAHPDRHAADAAERGREDRPIVQAMKLGEGHRLKAALARGRDRHRASTGTPDAPGTRPRGRDGRSSGRARRPREVALGIGEPPGPRLDDPEIQQRDSTKLAAHRDRSARLVGDRRVEQVHLLDHVAELTAAPRQRQPQRRDRHRQAAAASRRSALDVGLGQRQLSGRLLQAPLVQLGGRVSQRQVGMVARCAFGKRPQHRVDRSRLHRRAPRLNEWSATSRAASGQSPAASVWRTASTMSPWSANQRAARRWRSPTSSADVRRSSRRRKSARSWW